MSAPNHLTPSLLLLHPLLKKYLKESRHLQPTKCFSAAAYKKKAQWSPTSTPLHTLQHFHMSLTQSQPCHQESIEIWR